MKTLTLDTAILIEAANSADGWHCISPYGEHPHSVGIQRVDAAAATAMASNISSAFSRIRAALGFGSAAIPVYRGHPDDGTLYGLPGHEDYTRYAEIDHIEGRENGVHAHFVWANAWQENKANFPKLYISPRWLMAETAKGSGRYRPVKLLSVGLVEQGQIPGTEAVNSAQPISDDNPAVEKQPINNTDTMNKEKLLKLLGLPPEATDEQINAALEAALTKLAAASGGTAANTTALDALIGNLVSAKATAEAANVAAKTAADAELATTKAALVASNASAAAERKARSALVLEAALSAGKITAAERPSWETRLHAAPDFIVAANELSALPVAVKTNPQVDNVAARNTAQDASSKYTEAVNSRIKNTGESYQVAFSEYGKTAEGKALLEKMEAKATA